MGLITKVIFQQTFSVRRSEHLSDGVFTYGTFLY